MRLPRNLNHFTSFILLQHLCIILLFFRTTRIERKKEGILIKALPAGYYFPKSLYLSSLSLQTQGSGGVKDIRVVKKRTF